MKESRFQRFRPFILVALVTAILFSLSFFDTSYKFGNIEFRNVSVISDITSAKSGSDSTNSFLKNFKPFVLLPDTGSLNADSLRKVIDLDARIIDYGADNQGILLRFFTALHSCEKDEKKARIAYFGDSMIEGDLVTQTVRNYFQKKFGGRGVGFVPITSVVSYFRKSVVHKFSENWNTKSVLDYSSKTPYGLSGFVFYPQVLSKSVIASELNYKQASMVTYKAAQNSFANVRDFSKVVIYYGKSDTSSYVVYEIGDSTRLHLNLSGRKAVNEIVINNPPSHYQAPLYFMVDTTTEVFGVSLESNTGVFLDNYSVRGTSGLPLSSISPQVIQGLNRSLEYNLIVLQFGLNVSGAETKDFAWYKAGMIRVVRHLQAYMPDADILLVGVCDRSYKKDMKYQTMPSIPLLVEAQREVAKETGIAFWNLYAAMGGDSAMVRWANAKPALANKDYTHVNGKGADTLGLMLWNNLYNEYLLFKRRRELAPPVSVSEPELEIEEVIN
ncbi:MAG: hypothetical protein KKA07_02850 [Bacteroidetes bacterium]|nr:hypothetical protein [Bacteroidota bacterium]MBU1717989.1 hypothetical protein [Bacteroidota bacterium]